MFNKIKLLACSLEIHVYAYQKAQNPAGITASRIS